MNLHRATITLTLALTLMAACSDDTQKPGDTTPPARVTDLSITGCPTATTVTLKWSAPGDDGNTGKASSYRLKQSNAPIDASNFSAATAITGVPAPAVAGTVQSFAVTGLDSTLTHYFALRTTDESDNTSAVSNNVERQPGVPLHFTKDIPPFKDNSMFEEGDYSNGVGEYIFAGENANGDAPPPDARRALLAFAIVDSLPPCAVVDSVRLQLHVSKTPAVPPGEETRTMKLHQLTADWGEGASDAPFQEGTGADATTNDATWVHRFFNTVTWTTPGGDFTPGASAQRSVGNIGFYVWSSAQMAADVQSWLDTPANNFGWIVIGDESVPKTAKRFDSRENPTAANRPRLTVYYTVP